MKNLTTVLYPVVKAAKALIIAKPTFRIRLLWTIVYIDNRPNVR